MDKRRIRLEFSRPLDTDEQLRLIAQFKGLAKASKDQIKSGSGSIGMIGKVPMLGQSFRMKNDQFKLLTDEIEVDGYKTTALEQMFRLEFDDGEPTVYRFEYPHMASLVGADAFVAMLKAARIKMDGKRLKENEEIMVKGFCKTAGVIDLLVKYEANDVHI
jgi:hypothetical protein